MARIHRFNDKVAIDFDDSPTIYLSPKIANAIGHSLMACAQDVNFRSSINSPFLPVVIEEKVEGSKYRIFYKGLKKFDTLSDLQILRLGGGSADLRAAIDKDITDKGRFENTEYVITIEE